MARLYYLFRSVTHRIEILQDVYRLKGNIKVEKHSDKKQKKKEKEDKDTKDTHLKVTTKNTVFSLVNIFCRILIG